ncbi:hypothetical protein [Microbacterium sp. M28]|uniref:hypothetical protein n=1 Tax=Microbacterium sp. M28 TaxID=2962064 RepID=UPI00298F64CC|nr:hypothetical protein [Microbacterium sp. M28]
MPRIRRIAASGFRCGSGRWPRSTSTGLSSAGFLLDQSELVDVREGVLAAPPLGSFRTFQVPVGDIARTAAVDLGPLVDADVLPEQTVQAGVWRELETYEDVVL